MTAQKRSGFIFVPNPAISRNLSGSSKIMMSLVPQRRSPALQARAAAVTVATLQGAVLFHDGQFEGRRVRLPVFLRRRPKEPTDRNLQEFYTKLLGTLRRDDFRGGQWQLCERTGWPDNQSHANLVAWCWTHEDTRHLIVVNLSDQPAQGNIWLPASALEQEMAHGR